MESNKRKQNNIKPINKKRRKKSAKKSKYILIGAVAVTAAVILLATVVFSHDKVLDESNVSSEQSELLLTVSSDKTGFPITFSNNDIIKSDSFSSKIFVLGKKILTCVSSEGKVTFNKIFTFSNPDMTVSDKYGIVFDRASSQFFIFTDKGVIYEGETENGKHIITADINNNGDVALVTKSDDSACRVYLLNKKGQVKYIWSCAEEYAVALDINQSGDEILCGALGSENGIVYSEIYLLDIFSDTEKAAFKIDDNAVIDVQIYGKKLIATCNEGRFIFNSRNTSEAPIAVEYTSNVIACGADGNGNTAVVTNKVGSFGTNEITVYNKNNEIGYKGFTDENIVDVLCRGKKVYLLTDKAIYESLSDGTFEKTGTKEISGDGMVICKSRMYYYSTGQIDLNS